MIQIRFKKKNTVIFLSAFLIFSFIMSSLIFFALNDGYCAKPVKTPKPTPEPEISYVFDVDWNIVDIPLDGTTWNHSPSEYDACSCENPDDPNKWLNSCGNEPLKCLLTGYAENDRIIINRPCPI